MMSRLPDFVVIGAQRSGTTSLYRYLDRHPDIFMAPTKEVHFFDRHFENGVAWYCKQFDGAHLNQVVGEATPRYMADPRAVERLAEIVPHARLVALLRDPVERAYSHYWMERARGRERRSFEEAIAVEEGRKGAQTLPAYLGQSRYLTQLQRICGSFRRDQLLVMLFDDLRHEPGATLAGLCRFLGVEDSGDPSAIEEVNQFVAFRSLTLRRMYKRLPLALSPLTRALGRLNTKSGRTYPPMRPETRKHLVTRFASENRALGEWLDRDLEMWNQR